MRNMSFMLTTAQIKNRTKTVTRRVGWTFLKPGDLIQAIEKGQGLKKGEKVKRLAVLRVETVRRERLDLMHNETGYGLREAAREGFPDMTGKQFVNFFCSTHKVPDKRAWGGLLKKRTPFPMLPCDEVTRIEFSYVSEDQS